MNDHQHSCLKLSVDKSSGHSILAPAAKQQLQPSLSERKGHFPGLAFPTKPKRNK
jgi:hypothetical protein